MKPVTPRERIDRHDRLFRLYLHAGRLAEILDKAGNHEGAAAVLEDCRAVARNHDLDHILRRENQS